MSLNLQRYYLSLVCVVYFLNLREVQGSSLTSALDDGNAVYAEELIRYAKSAEIRNYLNESQDPCENFYNFACGNYYRINPPDTPPYQRNIFQSISKTLSHRLLRLLQEDDEQSVDTPTDQKVKHFFDSCLNIESLSKAYRSKLLDIVKEFGKMPVLEGDQWQESEFDWLKTVAKIAHKYNIHMIIGYLVDVDYTNHSINRMSITAQDMPLKSRLVYSEEVHALVRNIRKNAIAQRLQHFLELETSLANRTAEEIFEFETRLVLGYSNSSILWNFQQRNHTNKAGNGATIVSNLLTIEEMQRKYQPHLDFKRWLNISLGFLPTGQVNDLIEPSAANIAGALKQTPARIVANYIFYNLLENFMFAIPKEKHILQDWCVITTKSYFAKVLDNMIYRNYITDQTIKAVEYLWQIIKTTFQSRLDSNQYNWMMEDTRRHAADKLKNMRLEINSYQQTNFSEEFHELKINSVDYIENIKALLVQSAIKWRQKVTQPPTTYDNPVYLSFTPVNIQDENLIKVPVSILQPYFMLSEHYPNSLNFATLGFLLSHELLHAFDEEGKLFDESGNLKEWFDPESNDYFKKQTNCFSLQYHRYNYSGRPLPLLDSQTENTADNGGLRLAYNSYLHWYEDAVRSYEMQKSQETMPRLKYTNKQLFFISYGQLWCSSTHPLIKSYAASIDDHVPNEFRAIVPLSNLPEFSKEFNCPFGTNMNPAKKCILY